MRDQARRRASRVSDRYMLYRDQVTPGPNPGPDPGPGPGPAPISIMIQTQARMRTTFRSPSLKRAIAITHVLRTRDPVVPKPAVDLDFDLDLEANFYEAQGLFHNDLGFKKRADDEDEPDEEENSEDGDKKEKEDEEVKKDEN